MVLGPGACADGLSPAPVPPVLLRAHPEGGHAPLAQPLGLPGAPVARPPLHGPQSRRAERPGLAPVALGGGSWR